MDAQQEEALLADAYQFAVNLIAHKQGSADEFTDALVNHFGSGIKLCIIDLVTRLQDDGSLTRINRDYVVTVLTPENIKEVLQGKVSKRPLKENTLDELFARSSAYRSSDKFIEAITFVSKLREYAPFNNMLVYLQRPTATYWATASHWRKAYGRKIKEDARPLIMLQPMGPVMLAYDIEDTEGPPLPAHFNEPYAVEGHLAPETYDMTLKNCALAGIVIKHKKLNFQHAGTAIKAPDKGTTKITIELNESHDLRARYATLCHELAHIYLGHLGGDMQDGLWVSRLGLKRNQRELEAEAVAYMVCYRAQLITKSAEYLAGYLKDQTELEGISIDLVMKIAGLIERMGREVVRPRKPKQSSEK